MTSHIVATCQQTRFHLIDDKRSPEVLIPQLNISITSTPEAALSSTKATKAKSRSIDILNDADLKLKGGRHYGLLGRNGTGKSTLLRAIASKLIPGLSYATKISILQQTALDEEPRDPTVSTDSPSEKTPLQYVLASDTTRNDIEAELQVLKQGSVDPSDNRAQILAYRTLRCTRLRKQLAEVQKNATLRSGARGSQARKELIAFEKVVDEAEAALENASHEGQQDDVAHELASAAELESELQLQLDELRLIDLESQATKILKALGFTGSLLETPFRKLSGGWKMRCVLASALIQDADIMILDEPTNFLDLLGIIWLQRFLVDLRVANPSKTVVLVSHDRDFIDAVCEEIIILKDCKLTYFDGNLTSYEDDLRSRRLNLTSMKEAQEKQNAQKEKSIAQAIKSGKKSGDDNKLRQAASRQRKMEEKSGMQVNAKGHRFKLNRDLAGYHLGFRAEIEIPPDEALNKLSLPVAPVPRTTGSLVALENISITFRRGDRRTTVLKDISLSVYMGARIGIMGLNGSGKTTLIKAMIDQMKVSSGTVTTHPSLKVGYYSQLAIEELRAEGVRDASLTALRVLATQAGEELDEGDMRGLLGSFGLPGRIASDVPISKLSGGQLVRLALACIVWSHPHLLVLDEITTHLDFYTVKALAKALLDFNGAVVLVSHDRFLMRAVIEGDVSLLGEESSDGDEDETDVAQLRRELYLLKGGSLLRLTGDVAEFEKTLDKKVAKLLA